MPPQEVKETLLTRWIWTFFILKILSRDSVTVTVDAVVYYMVHNPTIAVSNVENFRYIRISWHYWAAGLLMSLSSHSTRLLAATTLRNVLGTKNLSEILSEREVLNIICIPVLLYALYEYNNTTGHLSRDAERAWWGYGPMGSQSWKSRNVSST